NATPGFYVFNQLARRLNMGLGSAELGGSDAHILDAVGRAFTMFPGKTPKALRTASESATTVAGRTRYRAMGLMRYAAWGLNHQRYVAVGRKTRTLLTCGGTLRNRGTGACQTLRTRE